MPMALAMWTLGVTGDGSYNAQSSSTIHGGNVDWDGDTCDLGISQCSRLTSCN
jgi:hypothetical protein